MARSPLNIATPQVVNSFNDIGGGGRSFSPERYVTSLARMDTTPASATGGGRPRSSTTSMAVDDRRKQTLMSILEALHELSGETGEKGGTFGGVSRARVTAEEEADDPTLNDALQTEGAENFNRFQRRIKELDQELRNFANAARQLGSSVGILSSAILLRHNLSQIRYLFRENASDLFPKFVKKPPPWTHLSDARAHRSYGHHARLLPTGGAGGGAGGAGGHGGAAGLQHYHLKNRNVRKPPPPPNQQNASAKKKKKSTSATLGGGGGGDGGGSPSLHELDPEQFPSLFEQLAEELNRFLERLNEFPEFSDEAVNASIIAFEGDLKYWASTLEEYKGQFRFPSVGSYLHDLSSEMGEHLDNITQSLRLFVEVGVPTIRFVQKHGASNLLNLSTVATFFSAVTATTLQFSFTATASPIENAVNTFWFASLVFSIASAVNSLLGLTWKQAMYRSPGDRVPWWVLIWIKRSPLIFLVVSVAAFSIGLVLFSYSSQQSASTKVITTVFTVFTSFGLIAVSLWFASERWAYTRHAGRRWLQDILDEVIKDAKRITGISYIGERFPKHAKVVRKRLGVLGRGGVRRMSFVGARLSRGGAGGGGDEEMTAIDVNDDGPALPSSNSDLPEKEREKMNTTIGAMMMGSGTSPSSPLAGSSPVAGSPLSQHHRTLSEGALSMKGLGMGFGLGSNLTATNLDGTITPNASAIGLATEMDSSSSPTKAIDGSMGAVAAAAMLSPDSAAGTPTTNTVKARWARAARIALMSREMTALPQVTLTPRIAKRQLTGSSSIPSADGGRTHSRKDSVDPTVVQQQQRLQKMERAISTLRDLKVAQELNAHSALVRHLQFSNDGKWLATCSWDRTTHVFNAYPNGDLPISHHKKLLHPMGLAGQVAWSPDGVYLLTKLTQSIKVWTVDGMCKATVSRGRVVQSIAWVPTKEGEDPCFMSVEMDAVCKINIHGKVVDSYEVKRLQLYDVAVTPDAKRFLGVASLIESQTGLTPVKSRPEKRIIVYNLEEKEIESQVPVLNEVRDITLGTYNSNIALVSYENNAPPQLWKLTMVREDVRLSLIHTYMPTKPVLWSGSSYFGGNHDQLVLCAGKGGDVHIWDRESGRLLHNFRVTEGNSDLTSIAWNPADSGAFMLATGTHDGNLKIWTATLPPKEEDYDSYDGVGDVAVEEASRSSSPEPMLDIELRDAENEEVGEMMSVGGASEEQPAGSGANSPEGSRPGSVVVKGKKPLAGARRLGSQIRHSITLKKRT